MFEIFSKSLLFFQRIKFLRKENRKSFGIFEILGDFYLFIYLFSMEFSNLIYYLINMVLNPPLDYNIPNTKW